MTLFSLCLLLGATVTLQSSDLPALWQPLVLIGAGSTCLLVCVTCRHLAALSGVALLGVGFGSLLAVNTVLTERSRQLTSELEGIDLIVTGRVTGIPRVGTGNVRFDVQLDPHQTFIAADFSPQPIAPSLLRLRWYGAPESIQPGQTWRLQVRLKKPRGLLNPGGFDYARWLFAQRIHATGYVRKSAHNQLQLTDHAWQSASRIGLAKKLKTSAAQIENIGLMQALLVGIRHDVPAQIWDVLRATGTSHLLAISGLHVGLLATWAYFLGSLLWRVAFPLIVIAGPGWNRVECATLTAGVAAIGYAWLAGFTLPTQRAVIMLGTLLVLRIARRHNAPMAPLSIALILILSLDPLAPLSAGFWLSFAAVFILLLLGLGRVGPSQTLVMPLRMHIALGVLLFPLTALLFGQGSLIAPLANLFAIPYVSLLVVPLLLSWLLVEPISSSASVLILHWTDYALSLLVAGLRVLTEQVTVEASLTSVSWSTCGLFLVGGFLLFLPSIGLHRWLVLPLCLPFVSAQFVSPPVSGLVVNVLDVGQGLSVVIQTRKHTLVYDTGGVFSSDKSMARVVVAPFLHARGVRSVDRLIVSHTDSDHSAGVAELTDIVSVLDIVGPEELQTSGMPVTRCRAGLRWQWDGVDFEILHPSDRDGMSQNDSSCTLLIRMGASRVLLPGDIEKRAERRLLSYLQSLPDTGALAPVTLLVAPHHGSKTSSTAEFIDAFAPKSVVYSVGYRNRFGFPHDSVQMRYKIRGATAYRTDRDGAIQFRFTEVGMMEAPTRFRQQNRHVWHNN